MRADAHFVIGQSHVSAGQPCQDYAVAGVTGDNQAYAVVSDGCSSAGQTDVGARLVALSTAKVLSSSYSPFEHLRSCQNRAFRAARLTLGLDQADLLATCGYIYADPFSLTAHLQGDGVIVWRPNRGRLMAARLDWDANTPVYPAYSADGFEAFIARHGGDPTARKLTVSYWQWSDDGLASSYARERLTLADAVNGFDLELPSDTQMAAVFTDGVLQIKDTDWTEAAWSLVNFKTANGSFVKRRLNRFIRDQSKYGQFPVDDLAYAAILLDQEDQ